MSSIISLNHYLLLSAVLFTIAILGLFMNRKNLISILMSIELMLLAVNINFVAFSAYLNDITGQIFTIFILTIAASEIAIGLAIVLLYFRRKASLQLSDISEMRG